MIKKSDFLRSDLWKLFPVINCDYAKDIPCDYPGLMGVPITVMIKIGRNDGHSGLLVVDCKGNLRIGNRILYDRLIIRNLNPTLPNLIDLTELLDQHGVNVDLKKAAGEGAKTRGHEH